MNAVTFTMDRRKAWNAFQEYRGALRSQWAADDALLEKAYRALARDRRILDLVATMRQAGQWPNGLPKLAIGRADLPAVSCTLGHWDGSVTFAGPGSSRRNAHALRKIRLPPQTFPPRREVQGLRSEGYATAPSIPPRFRPRSGGAVGLDGGRAGGPADQGLADREGGA